MRVLLIAMPDTVSALDAVTQMPNLGLCSIAGSLEECDVRIVDLVFHKNNIARFIQGIVDTFKPDIIGLSAMSHQYSSACRVASICRKLKPDAMIVLGGYHASLMYREISTTIDATLFDFIVRGEGEITFKKLVKGMSSGKNDFSEINGLSYRKNGDFYHNHDASLLALDTLGLPNRDCRIFNRAQFLGKSFDCVETSRGCTRNCHFCSIQLMYGRNVRMFPLERVINELRQLKERGTQGIFFVDDNITLNIPRLKNLCEFIIAEKLNSMSYIIQASVAGIASDPGLSALLKAAGFNWVFLGIENGIRRNLKSMGKEEVLYSTERAVSLLRSQGIGVFGGFIIGNPQDRKEDIFSTYKYALRLGVDHPIIQCLTPYPKTKTREELAERSLITNTSDFSLYNGFTCNIRTEHLSNKQLNRAMFWGGLGLYFNPVYLIRSRFWRYSFFLIPPLMMNNLRYLIGAFKGKVFTSRHTW